jgi:3-isopropylmalate dehydrogenase
MMLRHSLGLAAEAKAIEDAVDRAVAEGCRTKDLGGSLATAQMTDEVLKRLAA